MKRLAPILIIEDNVDDAMLLERALKRAEVCNPVHVVSRVSAAVQFLEKARPVVPVFVIISLDMFLASGEAVLSWMREQDYLKQVPVLALGSASHPQAIQQAYDLGVNAYFPKQFNMTELAQTIRDLEFLEEIWSQNPVEK